MLLLGSFGILGMGWGRWGMGLEEWKMLVGGGVGLGLLILKGVYGGFFLGVVFELGVR